jgi:hypothetical protein
MGIERRVGAHLGVARQADHDPVPGVTVRDIPLQADHPGPLFGDSLVRATCGADHGVGIRLRIHRSRCIDVRGIHHHHVRRHRIAQEDGAADVLNLARMLARRHPVGDFHQGALGVAEQKEVCPGVEEDGTAHLVRPVIIVSDAPQAGLDASDHDRDVRIGLAGPLGIDDHSPVRTPPALVVGRVGVVPAHPPIRGVAVDHRVHVPRGDAEEQIGPAKRLEGFHGLPVGLADDADAKSLGLQQTPDDRHAEAGVIDVGVTGDQDHVTGIPAQLIHLGTAHRQERGHAKAFCPVLAMGKQGLGCVHAGNLVSLQAITRWLSSRFKIPRAPQPPSTTSEAACATCLPRPRHA